MNYQRQFQATVRQLHNELLPRWQRVENLTGERTRLITERQRQWQLEELLDRRTLQYSEIPNIGPRRITLLEKCGIETALDVRRASYLPKGFGPALFSNLRAWVRRCEAQFVFNSGRSLPENELAEIDSGLLEVCTKLRESVREATSRLGALATETRMQLVQAEQQIQSAAHAYGKAQADAGMR